MNINACLKTVRNLREDARMSADLQSAIDELIQALAKGDLELGADISVVKSFIAGSMKSDPKNHFREDTDHNEKVLGRSCYGILDGIHHDLALATRTLPSGMPVLSASGMRVRRSSTRKSPTLNLIRRESQRIIREVRASPAHKTIVYERK
jgi:hypothetical protein